MTEHVQQFTDRSPPSIFSSLGAHPGLHDERLAPCDRARVPGGTLTRETGATSPVHFVRALCLAEDAPSSVAGLVTSFETA